MEYDTRNFMSTSVLYTVNLCFYIVYIYTLACPRFSVELFLF